MFRIDWQALILIIKPFLKHIFHLQSANKKKILQPTKNHRHQKFIAQECELNLINLVKSEVEFDEDYTTSSKSYGEFGTCQS